MRYKPFGAFRTFLAALVIVQHIHHVGPDGTSWGNWGTGSIAVLVFFALSGFVITEAAESFYRGRPLEFAVNRVLRIMPQYLLALIFSIGAIFLGAQLVPHFLPNVLVQNTEGELFNSGTLLVNLFTVVPGIGKESPLYVPYVWALRAEILFYAALAVTICIATYRRQLAYVLLAISGAFFYIACLIGRAPAMFQFTPYFAFGVVAYFTTISPSLRNYSTLAALFVVCLWNCISFSLPEAFPRQVFSTSETAAHIALFASLMLIILILANVKLPQRLNKIDRRIGDLSFPLYLQQHAVLVLTFALLPRSYTSVMIAFVAALLAAWISDLIIETPLRFIRDRVRGKNLKISEHDGTPAQSTWPGGTSTQPSTLA